MAACKLKCWRAEKRTNARTLLTCHASWHPFSSVAAA